MKVILKSRYFAAGGIRGFKYQKQNLDELSGLQRRGSMNFLIIDVGTSSMRGILFSEKGKALHMEQIKYSVSVKEHGWVEQNPHVLLNGLVNIVKRVVEFAAENQIKIQALALTAQRSSVIPIDREGNALCHAQMWQDKRTVPICRELENYNKEIFHYSGSRVNPVFSGPKMAWLRKHEPEIYKKAWKLVVIPDYLMFHMTGNLYTDYTYGSRSLLMNLETYMWEPVLLERFGIEEEKLCELKPPGSIMGYITAPFSECTGLEEGIPVISSGGDQQCGMLGQGVTKPGEVSLTLGTGGFLLTPCTTIPEHLSWDVVCNASSDAGTYILESNILTCTSAMEWFKNNFYCEEKNFYSRLNEILREIPAGAHGCKALPYLQGRSTPDWNSSATGMFFNLTLGTTREDMLKALLESICMEISNNIRSFEKYVPVKSIYINGGLSRSEEFNQMQAEIYGKTIIRTGQTESTAVGALMIAARTMGCYDDLDKAFAEIQRGAGEGTYESHPEIHNKYIKMQEDMNWMYGQVWQ